MTTISIERLRGDGMSVIEVGLLESRYGTDVMLAASEMSNMQDVNVFWFMRYLPRAAKKEQAFAWYDRSLATASLSWKASVRALLDTPIDVETVLQERWVETRATACPSKWGPAVGYSMCYLAKALRDEDDETSLEILAGMNLIAVHGARCAAESESGDPNAVLSEFRTDVLTKLDAAGIVP